MYSKFGTNPKTQKLRQTIRHEYIQSYKKKIRLRFEQRSLQAQHPIFRSFNDTESGMIEQNPLSYIKSHQQSEYLYNLNQLLEAPHPEICTNDSFQYLIECMYRNNRHASDFKQQFDSMKGKKSVGSSWAYKEKINSLVYRIVDKILIGSEYENVLQPFNRIKTIAEQLVLLLDFPEIMPLWEKISLLNDQELKDYYADKFVRVVLQDNKHQIFDSDFVLDVISNFIVNSPEICFEKSKELLKYVSYQVSNQKEINYYRLNKICMVLRSILKDNGAYRFIQLIEFGFEHLFLILINLLISSPKKPKSKGLKNEGYECENHDTVQLFSTEIIFKISLMKLINRLFMMNCEASRYIYSKTSNFLIIQLIHGLQSNSCRQISKYKFILCKSHESLCRNILITLTTVLMTKISNNWEKNPIRDFIGFQGMKGLGKVINLEGFGQKYMKQVSNLMSALQVHDLFWSLTPDQFNDLMDFTLTFFITFGQALTNMEITNICFWGALHKTLKMIKSCLLAAYSRATQPFIYQQLQQKIYHSDQIKQNLYIIIQLPNQLKNERRGLQERWLPESKGSKKQGCRRIGEQILQIVLDVKNITKIQNGSNTISIDL